MVYVVIVTQFYVNHIILLTGAILIYTASDIENLLPETGRPDITMLAYIFFMINFLAATQDIAVDGWALTMLKKWVL